MVRVISRAEFELQVPDEVLEDPTTNARLGSALPLNYASLGGSPYDAIAGQECCGRHRARRRSRQPVGEVGCRDISCSGPPRLLWQPPDLHLVSCRSKSSMRSSAAVRIRKSYGIELLRKRAQCTGTSDNHPVGRTDGAQTLRPTGLDECKVQQLSLSSLTLTQKNPFMANQTVLLTENERNRVVRGILIAVFLSALDQNIVSPAMPTIGAELGDGLWLSWVISAYLLTSMAVTPLLGKLADLRGRRPILYACITMFMAGSLICALAPTMAVLIGGRAVQGIGGGGLFAVVPTIIADVAPPKERGRYYVYISTVWAVSSVAGPVVGGVLAEYVHWSMIFWINLPIGTVCYVMSSRALANVPDVRRPHNLDVLGAAMVIVATLLLLLALSWGGAVYPWTSPTIGGLTCASLLLFSLFAWCQLRQDEPLLPTRMLRNPIIAYGNAAAFFATMCPIGLSVYFPVYLQLIEEFGAASSGVALIALMSGITLGSTISARYMQKSTRYKRIGVFGACITALALALLALVAGKAPFAIVEVAVAVAGIGSGTIYPIVLISVQNASEQHDLGITTATFVFFRGLGFVVGLAALSAIVGPTQIASYIGSGIHIIDGDARTQVTDGFRWVFCAAASSQVLSLLFLMRMEERPLRAAGAQTCEAETSGDGHRRPGSRGLADDHEE